MNAITKVEAPTRAEVIDVLRNSLYPGASVESVEMALSYCRVNGIDPMLKAVHIVPMWDKESRSMRDVLMPGIADYRIKAARSGSYAGKDEPEFGPDVTRTLGGVSVTFPQWCRVTIKRLVNGSPQPFTAKEFWTENYATAKRDTDAPNAMWKKRPYGQLAKCAEAQALRMAFPEFSGGQPTAEEMEGKTLDGFTGQTINAAPEPQATNDALGMAPPRPDPLSVLRDRLAKCQSLADVQKVKDTWQRTIEGAAANGKAVPTLIAENATTMLSEAFARLADPDAAGEPETTEPFLADSEVPF